MLTAREQRLRRKAKRLGYQLRKSRAAIGLDNAGGYMIVDPYTNIPVGGFKYDLTLDYVEEFLAQEEQELRESMLEEATTDLLKRAKERRGGSDG